MINFLEEELALDRVLAAQAAVLGKRFYVVGHLRGSAGSTLLRMGSFEVVARHIDGNGLDVSCNGFGVLGCEVTEETTSVGAEFEVGVLYEVVHHLLREGAPLAGGPDDGKTDRTVETGSNSCQAAPSGDSAQARTNCSAVIEE